jgi:nucleotide-binding universal stress UspA family protein
VIVAGARGVDAMERLLLGSGAEGLLTHSPGSVLVVR